MKNFILFAATSGVLLSSCGTGKKLAAANQQIDGLNTQVATLTRQVADDKQAIDQLKTENIQYGKEAEDCRKAKEAVAKRLDNINRTLAEQNTSLDEVREKSRAALARLNDAGAEVTHTHGFVRISMPERLVFPSGSTVMSDQGKQAMSIVADILEEYPGLTAIIVGNTDSIAIRKTFQDNWSLSTERANAIVRLLRDKYHVDPSRLTAAGKGKYNPIGDNATPEGRAMNRRTEILINPNMDKFWEMSKKQD